MVALAPAPGGHLARASVRGLDPDQAPLGRLDPASTRGSGPVAGLGGHLARASTRELVRALDLGRRDRPGLASLRDLDLVADLRDRLVPASALVSAPGLADLPVQRSARDSGPVAHLRDRLVQASAQGLGQGPEPRARHPGTGRRLRPGPRRHKPPWPGTVR